MSLRFFSTFALAFGLFTSTAQAVTFKPNLTDRAQATVLYRLDLRTLLSDAGSGQLTWRLFSDKPGWISLNPPFMQGTPAATDAGVVTFRISVVDNGTAGEPGAIAQLTLTIVIVPIWSAGNLTLTEAREDVDYSYDLSKQVTVPGGGSATFQAISGKPAWMNLTTNGLLGGRPARADVGNFGPIVFRASTASGFSDVNAFITVRKTLHPPKWTQTSFSVTNANEDFPYDVNVSGGTFVSNFEQAALTFTLPVGTPSAWLQMTPAGHLTGTPGKVAVGPVSVTGRLSAVLEDGKTYTSDATFVFNVIHTNHAPKWTSDPILLANAPVKKTYTANVTGFASDPDNDPLSYRIVSGPAWATMTTAGVLSGTPTNAQIGVNEWTIEVSDGTLKATTHARVTVFNSPPKWIAKPTILPDTLEDAPYVVDLSTYASDPDGDPLTFTITAGPPWAVLNGTQLTGTPRGGNLGTQTFTISVGDGLSGTDSATVTVFVEHVNHSPQWTQSPLVLGPTDEKKPFTSTVGLFAKDIDAGDTLTFSKVNGPAWLSVAANGDLLGTPGRADVGLNTFRLRVADQVGAFAEVDLLLTVTYVNQAPYWTVPQIALADAMENSAYSASIATFAKDDDAGDTLVFSKVSGPAWLTVAANGSLSGTPVAADIGPVSAVFRVSDGKLSATINASGVVLKMPRPPVIHSPALTFTVKERQTLSVNLNQAQYVEGQNGLPLSFTLVDTASWVTLSPDGTLTATPQFAQIGTTQYHFRAADSKLSAEGVITIVVQRDPRPPVWSEDPVRFQTLARVPFTASVADKVSDLDGLPVTFAKKAGPAWLTVSAAGQLSGTPPDAQLGDNTFLITASNDLAGADGNVIVTVLFNNHPPVIDPTKLSFSGKERQPLQVDFVATGAASDPDHDTLAFTLVDTADWVQLSPAGILTANPLFKDIGTHSFGFRVSDGKLTVNGTFQIQVTRDPRPPMWLQDPVTLFGTARVPFTGTVGDKARDLDGLPISFSKKSGPAWLTVAADGSLTGTPADGDVGDDTFLLTVKNDLIGADATLVVKIAFNPHPPVIQQPALSFTVKERSQTTIDLADPKYVANVDGTPLTFRLIDTSDFVTLSAAGQLLIQPQFRHIGPHTFQFTVANGALVANGHIDITVVRDPRPPVWTANPVLFQATARVPFSDTLAAKATDQDGIAVTFAKKSGPAWLTVAADGKISGTPGDSDVGNDDFVVTATNDVLGADGNVRINVIFNPHPPVLLVDALKFTIKERQVFTENLNQPKYVTNVDGTPLVFQLLDSSTWVTLGADGTLTATPLFANLGVTKLKIRVANGGLTADGTLELTVVRDPRPPIWKENPITLAGTARVPFTGKIDGKAQDLDGLPLTFSKKSGPQWLTVAANGTLSGTPGDGDVGADAFVVTVANDAASADATLTINVAFNPHPPVLNLAAMQFQVKERQALAVDLSQPQYVTNVDGTPLTFTLLDSAPWVALSAPGMLNANPQHAQLGTHSFRIRVANGPTTADGVVKITVLRDPQPPVWSQNPITFDTKARVPFTSNISSFAKDLDGIPLVFTKKSGPAWLAVSVDGTIFGTPGDDALGDNAFVVTASNDGIGADVNVVIHVLFNNHAPFWTQSVIKLPDATTTVAYAQSIAAFAKDPDPQDKLVIAKVSGPAWVQVAEDGAITGTPAAGDIGLAAVQVSVTDPAGLSAQATVQINVIRFNHPPVWLQNPVLLSDGTEDTAYGFSLKPLASDEDSDALTFRLVAGPDWMKVAADGTLTGTPRTKDIGTYTATFEVSDGRAAAQVPANGRVLKKIVPPVIHAPIAFTVKERQTLTADLSQPQYVEDPNGLPLSFTLIDTAPWVAVGTNGALALSPQHHQVGSYTFRFRVSNGKLFAEGSFAVAVLRDPRPPVWSQNPITFTTKAREPFGATIAGQASDLDGMPLTFTKKSGPAWLVVGRDGSLSGTPGDDQLGTNTFVVTALNDALGADVTVIINVIFNNHPPYWVVDPVNLPNALIGSAYGQTVALYAKDQDPLDVLTFSKVGGPAWLNINSNGDVSGVPQQQDLGLNEFRVRVTDPNGAFAIATVKIIVEKMNTPPKWLQDPILLTDGFENENYHFNLGPLAKDDDNDPLFFRKISGPAWLLVDAAGQVSGTPGSVDVGNYVAIFEVTDGKAAVQANARGRVLPKAKPPQIDQNALYFIVKERQKLEVDLTDPKYVKDSSGLPLTFELLETAPWIMLSSRGLFIAQPLFPQIGDHHFRFRVSNGQASAEAVLNVKVLRDPRPPVWAVNPIRFKAKARVAFVQTVADKVTDLDGQPLKFAKKFGAEWLTVDPTGNIFGTPQNDVVGENTFLVTATNDGVSADVTVIITVEPNNLPPFWTQDPIRLPDAKENRAYLQSVASYAKDPDAGDILTFRKLSGPDWVFIGNGGTVLGTPTKLDEGLATIRVRITDPWGAFADATVLINVVGPRPPRWLQDPIPLGDIRIGQPYAFDLAPLAVSDDGLPLSFVKVSGPSWMQVALNGKITGTPASVDIGSYTAVFATSDGTYSVQVNAYGRVLDSGNGAPIFVPGALHFLVRERQVFIENISDKKYVYDPEGDAVTLEIVTPPSWVTLSPQGILTLRPLHPQIGDYTFAVKATDDKGHVAQGAMFVRVLPDPQPPIWLENPIRLTAKVNQSFTASVADKAKDPNGLPLMFSKRDGPLWLTVAADGSLSGIPLKANLGENTFTLVVKNELLGAETTLIVTVKESDPVTDTIQIDEADPGRTLAAENLWVVDNSSCSSQYPISFALRNHIPSYFEELEVKRVQHTGAYLSADPSRYDGSPLPDGNGKLLMLWNDPDWVSGFQFRLMSANNGHCYSSPIWSMNRFYKKAPGISEIYHNGYFTEHLPMDVLIATPHQDHFSHYANGTAQATWTPEQYVASFQQFETNEKQPYRISVIAPECPQRDRTVAAPANPFKVLVDKTKGDYFAVGCQFDMADILRRYADKVAFRATVSTHHRIKLSKTPENPAAIDVSLGGVPLAKTLWSYDAATNEIVIDWYKIDFSTLHPGDKIVIKYRT